MEQNETPVTEAQPQATSAGSAPESVRIPVKFNKESRELSLEEATAYAQKGMKFDQISHDLERLRTVAQKRNQSLSAMVDSLCREDEEGRLAALTEQCGGNEKLARHVLELENTVAGTPDSFAELRENFPEIKSVGELPESVVSAAETKGTRLLDEYLRYRLQQQRQRKQAETDRKNADLAAVGSQKRDAVGTDPVQMEFLRGLWGA